MCVYIYIYIYICNKSTGIFLHMDAQNYQYYVFVNRPVLELHLRIQ